jgi:type IV secretion system protein VirB5
MSAETVGMEMPGGVDFERRAYQDYLRNRSAEATTNNVKTVIVVALAVVSVGLSGALFYTINRYADLKPLVIRINELGQAQAVSYASASTYEPREPELRYHLKTFFENYAGRERVTLDRDYPKALPYLKTYLEGRLNQRETQKVLDTFRDAPSLPDTKVTVKNVVLSELRTPPYQAGIFFERQAINPGTKQPKGEPETVTAQVEFTVLDTVPEWVRKENPLAIAITDIRISEPFK